MTMINTDDENLIQMVVGHSFSETTLIDACGKPITSRQCLDCVQIATEKLGYSLVDITCLQHPLDKLDTCDWCTLDGMELWNSFETEEPPPLLAKQLQKEFQRELREAKNNDYEQTVRAEYIKAQGI